MSFHDVDLGLLPEGPTMQAVARRRVGSYACKVPATSPYSTKEGGVPWAPWGVGGVGFRSYAGEVQGAGPRHDGLVTVKSENSAAAVERARKLDGAGEITIKIGGAISHQIYGVHKNSNVEGQLGAYGHGVSRITTPGPVRWGAAHDVFGSGTGERRG